jgi:HAD superfamily hydrolase (TIGR01490 family)
VTKAAIFDLDGTLFTGHTWQGVMRYLRRQRRNRRWLVLLLVTHVPLGYLARAGLAGRGRMRTTWARHMSWALRGMSEAEVGDAFEWIADVYAAPLFRSDVVALLREHKRRGDRVVLLSGTFEPLLEMIAARLGAEVAIGTRLAVRDGVYTGRTVEPTCQGEGKAERLREYLAGPGRDIDRSRSTAYADSVFDLPVLEMVGRPVAVYPDDELAATARERAWTIFPGPGESAAG